MSNSSNQAFDQINDEENQKDPRADTQNQRGTDPGSFANEGQGSASSIGSGSSDQGIEPGTENQEDEFRKGVPASSQAATFADGDFTTTDDDDKKRKGRNRGLVEEGPGPDA